MPAKSILIVDDSEDFRESVKLLLESEGYEVRAAPDGASGLAAARAHKPDLMILDVMMTTDTEGFDVSRAIAEDPQLKGLKIMMVTGIQREKNLPFAFEPDEDWLPVTGVFEKPIPPAELLAKVREWIG